MLVYPGTLIQSNPVGAAAPAPPPGNYFDSVFGPAADLAWTYLGPDLAVQPGSLSEVSPAFTKANFDATGSTFTDDAQVNTICNGGQTGPYVGLLRSWGGLTAGVGAYRGKFFVQGVGHTDGALNVWFGCDATTTPVWAALSVQNPLATTQSPDYPTPQQPVQVYFFQTKDGSVGGPSGHSGYGGWPIYPGDSEGAGATIYGFPDAIFYQSGNSGGFWSFTLPNGPWTYIRAVAEILAEGTTLLSPDNSNTYIWTAHSVGNSGFIIRYNISTGDAIFAALFSGGDPGRQGQRCWIPSISGTPGEYDIVALINSATITVYPNCYLAPSSSNFSYAVGTVVGTPTWNTNSGCAARLSDGSLWVVSDEASIQKVVFSGSPGAATATVTDFVTTNGSAVPELSGLPALAANNGAGINRRFQIVPGPDYDVGIVIVGDAELWGIKIPRT